MLDNKFINAKIKTYQVFAILFMVLIIVMLFLNGSDGFGFFESRFSHGPGPIQRLHLFFGLLYGFYLAVFAIKWSILDKCEKIEISTKWKSRLLFLSLIGCYLIGTNLMISLKEQHTGFLTMMMFFLAILFQERLMRNSLSKRSYILCICVFILALVIGVLGVNQSNLVLLGV